MPLAHHSSRPALPTGRRSRARFPRTTKNAARHSDLGAVRSASRRRQSAPEIRAVDYTPLPCRGRLLNAHGDRSTTSRRRPVGRRSVVLRIRTCRRHSGWEAKRRSRYGWQGARDTPLRWRSFSTSVVRPHPVAPPRLVIGGPSASVKTYHAAACQRGRSPGLRCLRCIWRCIVDRIVELGVQFFSKRSTRAWPPLPKRSPLAVSAGSQPVSTRTDTVSFLCPGRLDDMDRSMSAPPSRLVPPARRTADAAGRAPHPYGLHCATCRSAVRVPAVAAEGCRAWATR